MDALINKLKTIKKRLTVESVMVRAIGSNREVLEFVAELNTKNQLFEKGEDSRGIRLDDIGGPYAPRTIMLKRLEGLPTDRVTLFDTGQFHESFVARVLGSGTIEITANPIVDDGTDLTVEWGKDIIGLSEESLDELTDLILIEIRKHLTQDVFL
jgi:hypothetical protein